MVIVTDIISKVKKKGKIIIKKGFYMDGYLAENLYEVPAFLSKDFDLVGIISGRGKVRTGKSTIASQVGAYCAWLIAGGKMNLERNEEGKFILESKIKVTKSPNKPLNFSLKNYAFAPNDLMRLGRTLPKNSVIIYDEGRTGLDAKTTMTSLNRLLEDFFQECGQYNHVILIVLPDFFKLHADYAVCRSYFLIDVFLDQNFNRGFFNFFNEIQKDRLYNFGKKRVGIFSKYTAASPSFNGRFSSWIPFDKEKYANLKKLALKEKEIGQVRTKMKEQRDALMYLYKKETNCSLKELSEKLSVALKKVVGPDTFKHGIEDYKTYLEKKAEYDGLIKDLQKY